MRRFEMSRSLIVVGLLFTVATAFAQQAPGNLPRWAYGYAEPGSAPAPSAPAAADDGTPKTLQGSTGKFTLTQIRDGFGPADWHPGDHPPMPEIVARQKRREHTRLCAVPLSQRQGTRRERPGLWSACRLLHSADV
jgi:hypothetical protein